MDSVQAQDGPGHGAARPARDAWDTRRLGRLRDLAEQAAAGRGSSVSPRGGSGPGPDPVTGALRLKKCEDRAARPSVWAGRSTACRGDSGKMPPGEAPTARRYLPLPLQAGRRRGRHVRRKPHLRAQARIHPGRTCTDCTYVFCRAGARRPASTA
ncbi:hypothetical protein GCM10010446_08130 [Streptomyces enissocaesilis]|uniref:Uncharacterized protein n=1 Tax=Streptomyces enissocaesilis TaxID=332589 RepID=A0ABN3WSJ0_9ACTN